MKSIAEACQQVAEASGGGLGRLLGLAGGVSTEEESLLDTITATLRSRGDSPTPPPQERTTKTP